MNRKKLDDESDYHLNKIDNLNYWLRWIAVGGTGIVIFVLGIIEWIILFELIDNKSGFSESFIVLAISPVIAVTTILVFFLVGVFRAYKDTNAKLIPMEIIIKKVAENCDKV